MLNKIVYPQDEAEFLFAVYPKAILELTGKISLKAKKIEKSSFWSNVKSFWMQKIFKSCCALWGLLDSRWIFPYFQSFYYKVLISIS